MGGGNDLRFNPYNDPNDRWGATKESLALIKGGQDS